MTGAGARVTGGSRATSSRTSHTVTRLTIQPPATSPALSAYLAAVLPGGGVPVLRRRHGVVAAPLRRHHGCGVHALRVRIVTPRRGARVSGRSPRTGLPTARHGGQSRGPAPADTSASARGSGLPQGSEKTARQSSHASWRTERRRSTPNHREQHSCSEKRVGMIRPGRSREQRVPRKARAAAWHEYPISVAPENYVPMPICCLLERLHCSP